MEALLVEEIHAGLKDVRAHIATEITKCSQLNRL
jgi:hypothetical protein